MKKLKSAENFGAYKKLLITFRLPILLILLALLAYFVLRPATFMIRPVHRQDGVKVVPADGGQDFITIGPSNQSFIVDVANTVASREKGLSGRSGLDQSHGMLFVFDRPGITCFWMKDMLFDLDMLWFDQDLKLIHVHHDTTPASYPESFCPPTPAKYVIEVAAGTADRLHLKIGDSFNQP